MRVLVVPGEIQERIGEGAAFLAIQFLHPQMDLRHDPHVSLGLARRRARRPVPLQPAARIHQRAFILGEAGGGKLDHLGLDLGRVGRVVDAVIFPETGGFRLQRVHDDQQLQLGQRFRQLRLVGERLQGVEAWQI